MFIHIVVLQPHSHDGIRGAEWKAVMALVEGMKYWEADRWICLVERGVSRRKVFRGGEKMQWEDRTEETTARKSGYRGVWTPGDS